MKQTKSMAAAVALLIAAPAFAQTPEGNAGQILSSVPSGSVTVMGLYKQDVYDLSDNKIGKVVDMLVSKEGSINVFVVSLDAVIGRGKREVLVPMSGIMIGRNNGKEYLTIDATKDDLKNAQAFRYDPNTMTWTPEDGTRANARTGEQDRNKARNLPAR